MDENKFIEYIREQRIVLIEDGEEVSIDGVIERFEESLKEDDRDDNNEAPYGQD